MPLILETLFAAGAATDEKTAITARRLAGKDPRGRCRVYVMPAEWVESPFPRRRRASRYWPKGIANL
jgi:hypothetical protein